MKQNRYSFLSLFAIAALIFSSTSAISADNDNIYTHKVGNYTVSLLSEGQSDGNQSVLLNATPEQLRQYVPNGTFPMAVNTFLIQTPQQTILVDTGFGKKLFDNLNSLGVKQEQVDVVLLTHMHVDHIGGLLRDGKAAFPNARLYVAKQERDYWFNETIINQQPESARAGFRNAQNAINAYGENIELFTPDRLGSANKPLLPGITPIAAFGHTPGHSAFLVESDSQQLLIWGDLTHAMAIQMPLPEVAMTYDVNPQVAVESRKTVLNYVAENNIPVAGMHITYPGIGTVATAEDGGYRFQSVAR